MNLPPIKIISTTWLPPGDGELRWKALRDAAWSWYLHLRYDGPLSLHIADDGTTGELLGRLSLQYAGFEDNFSFSRQERCGVGASLNAGIHQVLKEEALLLYLVDDWELLRGLDLTPWAKLLEDNTSIGMVRFGPPHPDLTGQIIHHPACDWYMRLDRHHFAFSHRPALYHQRFFDAYGLFDENVNAYECERLYNERFCQATGPDIVLALPHPWRHIESVELAGITPG